MHCFGACYLGGHGTGWVAGDLLGQGCGQQYGFQSGAGQFAVSTHVLLLAVGSLATAFGTCGGVGLASMAGVTAIAGTSLVWQRQLVHMCFWVQLDGLATNQVCGPVCIRQLGACLSPLYSLVLQP
jgi:hypothetical protein